MGANPTNCGLFPGQYRAEDPSRPHGLCPARVHALSSVGDRSGSFKPVHDAPEPRSEALGYGEFVSFSCDHQLIAEVSTDHPNMRIGSERIRVSRDRL